jgi:hypothetical protein
MIWLTISLVLLVLWVWFMYKEEIHGTGDDESD